MFLKAYKRAFAVITKKPLRLWGLSLLVSLICILAGIFTSPFLIIAGVAYGMVVSAGMAKVYLDALDGKEVNSDQLFAGFKRFWTVLGGLAWKALWICIWLVVALVAAFFVFGIFALIAFSFRGTRVFNIVSIIGAVMGGLVLCAGSVFAYIKSLSYRFVEYILMTEPNVSATQALRKSVEMTKGKIVQLFLADLVFSAAVSVTGGILSGLTIIPYVGFLFGVVLLVFTLFYALFGNLFQGLYSAAFYKLSTEPEAEAKIEEPAQ